MSLNNVIEVRFSNGVVSPGFYSLALFLESVLPSNTLSTYIQDTTHSCFLKEFAPQINSLHFSSPLNYFFHQHTTLIVSISKTKIRHPHSTPSQAYNPILLHFSPCCFKLLQSCLTLCDPIDGSQPGSPVPGILQARMLEWVAISFSNAWKWKVKVKSLSRVQLFETPWTAAHQAPPSMGFPGRRTGVGCHCLLRFLSLHHIKNPQMICSYLYPPFS